MTWTDAAQAQIDLLNAGKPLAAIDAFFGQEIVMYANDELFATGKVESRAKQEPYISAAKSISGRIADVTILAERNICVFRNLSTFSNSDGATHAIDGLCWQLWADNFVIEERYYDGVLMQKMIDDGLLVHPEILLSTRI